MESAEIVGLIAMCDVAEDQPESSREYRFAVTEFAQLATGDTVVMRDGLGWTIGFVGSDGPPDIADVLTTVGQVVLPDEEDPPNPEPRPWEWLVELASMRDLSATVEQLKGLPYRIFLSERVVDLCG